VPNQEIAIPDYSAAEHRIKDILGTDRPSVAVEFHGLLGKDLDMIVIQLEKLSSKAIARVRARRYIRG